jgi:type IV pilus assembly protein PilA
MTKEKGFTLIELLIVLALIAILAAILIVVIKPGQIFMRARDTQRSGDLRNLSQAVDAYLTELAINPNLKWPERGACSSTANWSVFFSTTTTATSPPLTGWPNIPTGGTATGTISQATDGNGWVPLNFSQVAVLNLPLLPLDPRNGQTGGGVVFAYSFTCDTNFNYEFAAKLEAGAMDKDGGNQTGLYEVGPGKATLY